MEQVISVFIYFVIGIVLCAIGYKVLDLLTPFNLNEEIDNHNLAAGLSVAGLFIGIAIVVSSCII